MTLLPCLAQAVEALSASCGQDLQGLNTHIHCPENGQTVDLSEGAASLRMVMILLRAQRCPSPAHMMMQLTTECPGVWGLSAFHSAAVLAIPGPQVPCPESRRTFQALDA